MSHYTPTNRDLRVREKNELKSTLAHSLPQDKLISLQGVQSKTPVVITGGHKICKNAKSICKRDSEKFDNILRELNH